ncbi:metallophosphoesterase [Paucisalibacillus globulus]|uniref:metallophosphoesterase n=1 Tax=Paucisalibacillus globulus TaxID=351095 RepID=UPI001FDF32C3|nr:metallophosphoesterase [Paucisalibacillus globulus]
MKRRKYAMGGKCMPNLIRERKKYNRFLWSLGALSLCTLMKAYYDTNIFKVNKVQFQTKKTSPGSRFSILQLTDVHNKIFHDKNKKLIQMVNDVNADIVVLTGDLISRSTVDFSNVYSLIERILKINQNVFYVTGNHELGNDHVELFLTGLENRGVTILSNLNTQITIGDTVVNLVGIDNASTDHEDLGLAFEGVDEENYTILLSHSPNVVTKYDAIPADLILSGHTHGGQVRLPLIGAVVGPDNSFFPKLDKGIFETESGNYLYIDSGLGTTGYPVRFLNQSQISLIEVKGE